MSLILTPGAANAIQELSDKDGGKLRRKLMKQAPKPTRLGYILFVLRRELTFGPMTVSSMSLWVALLFGITGLVIGTITVDVYRGIMMFLVGVMASFLAWGFFILFRLLIAMMLWSEEGI